MFWRVEVKDKEGIFDAVGEGIKKDILDLGIRSVQEVSFVQVYTLEGDLSSEEIDTICRELLSDTVSQDYRIATPAGDNSEALSVEVAYNPGVMDPVEASILKGIRDLGIDGCRTVKTAKKYLITGKVSPSQLKTISEKLLYNKLIQHIVTAQDTAAAGGSHSVLVSGQMDSSSVAGYEFKLITVDLLSASDEKLKKISRDGQLFLSLQEMRHIKKYFTALKRNPTDCELETIAQTWSEHCWHKTFRGKINYLEVTRSPRKRVTRKIDNLLKSTIMKVTTELNKPWCVSVFKDNSGVIRFDELHNICFKVETHNHPSALEPFGGANTGIGGSSATPSAQAWEQSPSSTRMFFVLRRRIIRLTNCRRGHCILSAS